MKKAILRLFETLLIGTFLFFVFGIFVSISEPSMGMDAIITFSILCLISLLLFFVVRKKRKNCLKAKGVVAKQEDNPEKEVEVSSKTEEPFGLSENNEQISQHVYDAYVQKTVTRRDAELQRLENCEYDVVVIDFETTGIKSPMDAEKHDEILSVSIIDQDENVLLNTLCKPARRKTWASAQEIHGISPAMVKNQPTFEEIFPLVKEILYKAKVVIAYNIAFEMNFLWGYDLEFGKPGGTQLIRNVVWGPDPMLMFSAYRGVEKWQKLSTAARHFKFTYTSHDSLEDVKATLHCYNKLVEYVKQNPEKDYIIKYGFLYKGGKKGKWIDYNTYTIADDAEVDYSDIYESK